MAKPKTNDRDKRIGIHIRARRNELGLSLKQVGSSIGISYQALQKIEKGEYRISATQLESVAGVLGVTISYFLEDGYGIESDDIIAFAASHEGRAFYNALSRIRPRAVRQSILRTVLAIADEYESPKGS